MNVLVVDNTPLFHTMLSEVFSNTDIIPIFCNNFAHCFEQLQSQSIDFICLSMHLEDTDGISAAKQIRRETSHKHTPIILFTSNESNDVYAKALSSGVTEVFHKKDTPQLVNFIHRFTIRQQSIQGRILLVEDTLSHRKLVTQMFTRRGLQVDAYDNAEDAWQAYLTNDYDLIVTDIVLEGSMTGMAFTNRIRRLDDEKGDIPILALTAFDDISRRIDLFYLGVSDYVIKPVIEEELLARIHNLLEVQHYHRYMRNQNQLLEQKVKDRTIALNRAQKMEALGQLTGGVVHDFNNVLGIISGYCELLQLKLENQPLLMNFLHQIENATQRGQDMTGKLLAFSRQREGNAKTVCLNDLIVNQRAILEKSFTAKIELNVKLDDALWLCSVDTAEFEDMLLNMLINAGHAMADTGELTIQTLNIVLDNDTANSLNLPTGPFVQLVVSDTGHGIPEEALSKIFDPFFSTKGEQGTGLGLSQVYGFIQRSKGAIQVESTIDVGTQFTLYFPKTEGQIDITSERSQNTRVGDFQGHETILVVDDDAGIRTLVDEILSGHGYQVIQAEDVNQAMAKLQENPDIRLVLSDVVMPKIDGTQLADHILTAYPLMKIQLMSGFDETSKLQSPQHFLLKTLLHKPFKKHELLSCIHRLLNQSHLND